MFQEWLVDAAVAHRNAADDVNLLVPGVTEPGHNNYGPQPLHIRNQDQQPKYHQQKQQHIQSSQQKTKLL